MSWKLTRSSGEIYFLLPTCTCKIGRQGCQIVISDPTVSRHHANIDVAPNFPPSATDNPSITLKDVSKFVQTSVNGNLLSNSNRIVALHHGDSLVFGASSDTFSVVFDPLVLMTQEQSVEATVVQSISAAGASVSEVWERNSVGLLVGRGQPETSVPVLRALCAGIPLLSSGYIDALKNCQSGTTALPDPNDFPLATPSNEIARSSLFAGSRFILLADISADEFGILIQEAGGEIVELSHPIGDIYIVLDSLSQPRFDIRIERARCVSPAIVMNAIWVGRMDDMLRITEENLGPTIAVGIAQPLAGTGWISTKSITPSRLCDNVTPSTTQSTGSRGSAAANVKRFKKARVASEDQEFVPLQEWANSTILKRRNANDVVLKTVSDGMDDWLNSYDSQ